MPGLFVVLFHYIILQIAEDNTTSQAVMDTACEVKQSFTIYCALFNLFVVALILNLQPLMMWAFFTSVLTATR